MERAPSPRDRLDAAAGALAGDGGVSLYLYAGFVAMLVYRASILEFEDLHFAPFALALAKSLVVGRLIQAVQARRIGDSLGVMPMVHAIGCRSLVALAVLLAIAPVEDVAASLLRGRSLGESVARLADGGWIEIAASAPLLLLILVAYFAYREIEDALGSDTLRRMLFGGVL